MVVSFVVINSWVEMMQVVATLFSNNQSQGVVEVKLKKFANAAQDSVAFGL